MQSWTLFFTAECELQLMPVPTTSWAHSSVACPQQENIWSSCICLTHFSSLFCRDCGMFAVLFAKIIFTEGLRHRALTIAGQRPLRTLMSLYRFRLLETMASLLVRRDHLEVRESK